MNQLRNRTFVLRVFLLGVLTALSACEKPPAKDEAMLAGKTTADFPEASQDYFRDMDGGVPLTPEEVKGRNTWLIWTGGDEAFWDWLANNSFGTFDMLKSISSYPCTPEQAQYTQATSSQTKDKVPYYHWDSKGDYQQGKPYYEYFNRETRFKYLGLMNEPGFQKPSAPDQYGLCLDQRKADAPPEPYDEKVYGRPSGVMGLRLYPNPEFKGKAAAEWDAAKYYNDPKYYQNPKLIRPYRVGMSCAFCHISHHPSHPPADPENPEFKNLSGTIGAQYFWFGRIFGSNVRQDDIIWHILDSEQPGAVDTSLLPTDYIDNPRAMNAVFDLVARLQAGERWAVEKMTGGALNLPDVKKHKGAMGTPHILWDGSDSVGVDAALTRVYINIGEYHQEWIRHIWHPIVGGTPQSPITVKAAQENSVYWNATQERSGNLAKYLIRVGNDRMYLKDVPGGQAFLKGDPDNPDPSYKELLTKGKLVFADNCARCHSSKIPAPAVGLDEGPQCGNRNYLDCWNDYWKWTETDEFKQKMREIVQADDFLKDNYLSTDARIPVTTLETEICSSMASNAVQDHVWDNFSSATYKNLPAMGEVSLHDPIRDIDFKWNTPGGGRGYQRVPSLVAIWSTAPFLHNNEVGKFTSDPSVQGRMEAFDDAVHKMLSPEKREHTVHRTNQVTYLKVPVVTLPGFLQPLFDGNPIANKLREWFHVDWLVNETEDMVEIGPIPKGTPVNLIANVNLDISDPRVSPKDMVTTLLKSKKRFKEINEKNLNEQQATDLLKDLVPDLIKLSACPDFEVDRGHNFGTTLSEEDKEALIEFVKTF